METKDKPPVGGLEKKFDSLSEQRTNNLLINYFGYLTVALALIIFAAGLFLFAYPQYQEIVKDNETTKKNLQAEAEAKASYLNSIRDLKSSYQLISAADRKKIEDMVPARDKVISLIPEIESIVLKNGAVLNSIKITGGLKSQPKAKNEVDSGEKPELSAGVFEQLPEGVGLAKIEIDLSSVNYPVLKNLLRTFEDNLWLLDVVKVGFNVPGNKANFTIYSYYLLR